MYLIIKYIHVICVVLTITLFTVRGISTSYKSMELQYRWIRVVPHVIDTTLLLAGISLAVMLQQYPFVNHWLTAKFFALLVYIILGNIALKRGKTKMIRGIAGMSALITFSYLVMVAINHRVIP